MVVYAFMHKINILYAIHYYLHVQYAYLFFYMRVYMHIGDTSFNLFLASVSVELSLSS